MNVLTTREVGPSPRRYSEREGTSRQLPESYVIKFFSTQREDSDSAMHTPSTRSTTDIQACFHNERVMRVSENVTHWWAIVSHYGSEYFMAFI